MGEMAEMILEYQDEYWWNPPTVPKKKLMAYIKSRRRRRRKYVKMQKFTDEDFYIAIGRQALEWEYYSDLERRRSRKPSLLRRLYRAIK